jgi:hypothetical protein
LPDEGGKKFHFRTETALVQTDFADMQKRCGLVFLAHGLLGMFGRNVAACYRLKLR